MKVVFKELDGHNAMVKVFPDGYVSIIINSQISWETQRKAYLHELKHIKENDLFNHLSVSEIEKIRHSFPAELLNPSETEEQSNGVIGFYRKSQDEIEYEREQEMSKFYAFLESRVAK